MSLVNWIIRRLRERSNCLFYAVGQFIRDGGYLVIRRCREHRFCLHWLWMPSEAGPMYQYTGTEGAPPPSWIKKIWYRGRIKTGDKE